MSALGLRLLFDEFVDLGESERRAALVRLESSDPDSARRLRNLLRADRQCRTGDLPVPIPDLQTQTLEDFGPYRILQPLGEGGMGNVYLAEQQEPVRRTVAIKVVRRGWAQGELERRFAVEQQALAALSSPLIAQFYDAGTTPDGLPYFVMEHVDGVGIDQYCQQQRLGLRHRLQLFRQVCVAVQYAHTRGMVHRDLKPPNVLVTRVSSRQPVAKIIDFGIAKVLDEEPAGEAVGHRVLGTPDYMAPEQIAGINGPTSIDPRADVYALGVILYKLLTGRTPNEFARRSLSLSQIDAEMQRADPPRPSQVVAHDRANPVLACMGLGGTSPAKARRIFRDELDWIVMKAIHPEPDQRYSSAESLGEDLRRLLSNRPVHARPPTGWYRLRKLVARHKTWAAVLAVVTLAEIAIATTWSMQSRRIEAEARTTEQVLALMSGAFSAVDPGVAQGDEVTAREVVDRAAEQIQQLDRDNPARPRLHAEVGQLYFKLGLFERSVPLLEEAVAGYRELHGGNDRATLDALSALAHSYRETSRLEQAQTAFEEALALHRTVDGPDHEISLKAMGDLATVYLTRYEEDKALPLLEQGYRASRNSLGRQHATTLRFAANLTLVYARTRGHQAAIDLLEPILPDFESAWGTNHPHVIGLLFNLATWYTALDQSARAGDILDDILPRAEDVLGLEHPLTLSILAQRANWLSGQQRHEEAVAQQRHVYETRKELRGADNLATLRAGYNLNLYRLLAGHSAGELLPLAEEVLAGFRQHVGDDNYLTRLGAMARAQMLYLQGRNEEAMDQAQWAMEHGFDQKTADGFEWVSDLWEQIQAQSGGEKSTR